MIESLPKLQSKRLHKSKNSEDYQLYKAGVEWDLIEPIIIEDRKDVKSESKWRNLLEPFHHQVTNLITFCRRLPVTLIADDVGLGKTISAGLITSELMSRNRVSKILIVCPKLLIPQWGEELEYKFGIKSIGVTGKALIDATPPNNIGAVITTYNSARLYLDALSNSGFDMLILDEAHKLRNLFGVDNPPKVAIRFRQALKERMFKYVLMLTATPIQNRLWDIYSLIDLLTAARGHENPFGVPGMFARNFIADSRTEARRLEPGMIKDFRSIVFGYMSRVRRTDANLQSLFPDRTVQMHAVIPTPEELSLFEIIKEPIQELNRLAQISILQALISSPQALSKQLGTMALHGTIPNSLAIDVKTVVKGIGDTAKLKGLGVLIDQLKSENPNNWRLVIFTTRLETQTSIENFLGKKRIHCGLINGNSATQNQNTIKTFNAETPKINVIVSTEAGSEGVNLQSANVLVNFDLPWNPMVVEQRIGRVQRLASKHATVSIFNIILKDTFEEKIVGRLMEKLQMASNAIGDVEAMLEAADLEEGSKKNGTSGFEEKIRQLVLASLAGKDVESATKIAEKSILDAKEELIREEEKMNTMFGKMDDVKDTGPKAPKLPKPERSMGFKDFTLSAYKKLELDLKRKSKDIYISEIEGKTQIINFDHQNSTLINAFLFEPGTPAFERLVKKITEIALHHVEDGDTNPLEEADEISKKWVDNFKGKFKKTNIEKVLRNFTGKVLIRIRATVAFDSYERLVEVKCLPKEHQNSIGPSGIETLFDSVDHLASFGIIKDKLVHKALNDNGITKFCRFYKDRLKREVIAAGNNERKKKKITDEFTPRVEMTVVGLEGTIHRQLNINVSYVINEEAEYSSSLIIIPSASKIISEPHMDTCSLTKQIVPSDCLSVCEISKTKALKHLLARSEESGRYALPKHIIICSLSGKEVLSDEVEKSVISEKIGYKDKFIFCSETNQPLLPEEADTCEITGKLVVPGILEKCEKTQKKVIPSELEKSALTGKKALKKFFVTSSLSSARLLEEEAIRSVEGKFCSPIEANLCSWSGRKCHSDDLKLCALTRLPIYLGYLTRENIPKLEPLLRLIEGTNRKHDQAELWPQIASKAIQILNIKHCEVESAESSDNKNSLAVNLKVTTWLGLKVRYAALIYSIKENLIIGKLTIGKRNEKGWMPEEKPYTV